MKYKSPNAHLAKCPAVGCKRPKGQTKLVCYDHWMMLPWEKRREIDNAMRAGGMREAKKLIPEITSYFEKNKGKLSTAPKKNIIAPKYWWVESEQN